MSRLFDALQTYVTENSEAQVSDGVWVATDLLQSAEKKERNFGNFRKVHISPSARLVALGAERNLAAEKFRLLAVKLRNLQQKGSLKKVLVTSANEGEGKSFICINLATTLARRQHQKVLLIEGDLRRPTVAQEFGLPPLPGLCEALAKGDNALQKIVCLEEANTWLLPAGTPPENPLELMVSSHLPEVMNQISAWFDWVVIDSPPLLPLADAMIWSELADGTLLVTREGKTEKRQLARSLELLDRKKILGPIINGCTTSDSNNYYNNHYQSYRYNVPSSSSQTE